MASQLVGALLALLAAGKAPKSLRYCAFRPAYSKILTDSLAASSHGLRSNRHVYWVLFCPPSGGREIRDLD